MIRAPHRRGRAIVGAGLRNSVPPCALVPTFRACCCGPPPDRVPLRRWQRALPPDALRVEERGGLPGAIAARRAGARMILWELSERMRLRETLTRLYRVRVRGAENVPTGACILVANHESLIDPWFLSLATRRRVRFMAKAELWRYP